MKTYEIILLVRVKHAILLLLSLLLRGPTLQVKRVNYIGLDVLFEVRENWPLSGKRSHTLERGVDDFHEPVVAVAGQIGCGDFSVLVDLADLSLDPCCVLPCGSLNFSAGPCPLSTLVRAR